MIKVVVLRDEFDEGHVLAGITHSIRPEKGDKVKMQFTRGGPLKGYWKIIELTEKAPES